MLNLSAKIIINNKFVKLTLNELTCATTTVMAKMPKINNLIIFDGKTLTL
jgi:hypothetical protein